MDNQTIYVSLTPQNSTQTFNYAGTNVGYYSGGSWGGTLQFYQDPDPVPIFSFSCGNGFAIANPIFYTYSREGADDGAFFDGAAFSVTGGFNKIGLDLTVGHFSVSMSFKVLIAWVG